MASSDIEVVNLNNFEKIQNFLNEEKYKEILENSENFNTRLCIERRLRMPFLDPQTGVAQTHCALFMKRRQRMPGFREGQIYTYTSARWRKPKRQYLLNPHGYRPYQYREPHHYQSSGSSSARDHYQTESAAIAAADGNSMSASGDNDSKDSHANVEKEWFHEDLDMSHYHHVEDFEEDFESDNDFDESYSSRGKRRRTAGRSSRKSNLSLLEGTPKRGRKGGGGSRRRNVGDGEGGGDRRRRGNNAAAAEANSNSASNSSGGGGAALSLGQTKSLSTTKSDTLKDALSTPPIQTPISLSPKVIGGDIAKPPATNDDTSQSGLIQNNSNTDLDIEMRFGIAATTASPKKEGNTATTVAAAAAVSTAKNKLRPDREIAQPSPYCDFCLGDQRENKKTNLPEELVSCSDCGRSGHPSCLQFTPNMIISVKRYRWQCIECKYCSICGTSDNDDQLLFCDDCDRGYHMYCLSPPLLTPPEGSWSCKLCLEEFHKDEK